MSKKYLFLVSIIIVSGLQAQTPQKTKAKAVTNNNTIKVVVPQGSSLLSGMFGAPSGTNIVLQNNGKSDLSLVTQKESGKTYSSNNFSFATSLLDGTKFKVTLK